MMSGRQKSGSSSNTRRSSSGLESERLIAGPSQGTGAGKASRAGRSGGAGGRQGKSRGGMRGGMGMSGY